MTNSSFFIVDEFVSVTPGAPFRLFPFGKIVKNGKTREITREFASTIKLPHFKPPIKLGSHEDVTPAGGFIVGLEVRDDGLYALTEWNENGTAAITNGAYRYHSPEIIWEGGFEDPTNGEVIEGPLIVGDALLHTPHLGEATAFYSVEPIKKEQEIMTDNTVNVPAGFWEKLTARLFDEDQKPEPTTQPDAEPDNFAAQVETLSAQVEQLEREKNELAEQKAHAVKVDAFAVEFKETPLADNKDLFSVLAGLSEEDGKVITQELKALSEQAKLANLDKDLGGNGDERTPVEKFNAAVEKHIEDGLNRAQAIEKVGKETPDLITAVRGGK